MIQIVELECPNCGGVLQIIKEDTCKCNYCNAYFLIERQEDEVSLQPKETQVVVKPNEVKSVAQPNETKTAAKSVLMLILKITLLVYGLGFVVVLALMSLDFFMVKTKNESVQEPTVTIDQEEIEKPQFQSTYFRTFVEEIFSKPVEEVTDEELTQITSISLRDEKEKHYIDYRIQNGEEKAVEIKESIGNRLDDLQFFTGLRELNIGARSVGIVALLQLEQLESITCGNSPKEVANVSSRPERIKQLHLSFSDETLEGIETFSNLECLSIQNHQLISVENLAQVKSLKQLFLDTKNLMNYEAISNLSELEELEIESENLKDIEFMSSLEKLSRTSLISTKVVNINYLNQLPNLRHLTLDHDHEIADFSVLESLTDLESLNLYMLHPDRMPDLTKLGHLTDLTISGLMNLKSLQNLTQVERLCIKNCMKLDFSYLAKLTSLKELVINANPEKVLNLDALAGLPQLEVLDMSRLFLLDDCTWAFRKNGIKELYINDTHCAVDLSAMQVNETLKKLEMNHLDLYTNVRWHTVQNIHLYNYDELMSEDYQKLLSYFPNLEELSAVGDKIDSVEFAQSMPNLVKLDISDNYVKDLTMLKTLEKLEYVNATDNPITSGAEQEGYTLIR